MKRTSVQRRWCILAVHLDKGKQRRKMVLHKNFGNKQIRILVVRQEMQSIYYIPTMCTQDIAENVVVRENRTFADTTSLVPARKV